MMHPPQAGRNGSILALATADFTSRLGVRRRTVPVLGRDFAPGALLCLMFASLAVAADGYRVLHAYPHDSRAFTQGLVYVDGYLYESTGLNGQSTLRKEDLETGQVLQEVSVPSQYFAEGLTNWRHTLIQLTWTTHVVFVYERATLRLLHTLRYPQEGWGLTQNERYLVLSDGSETLHFLNPETFAEARRIRVMDHGVPVKELNELEYIHGEVYANVWMTDRIVRISPQTGRVLGWIDLAGILPEIRIRSRDAVLNGIAYDAVHNRLFVTGKLWPRLFEIQVVPEGVRK